MQNHVTYGRAVNPAKLPRWLRPKLSAALQRDLAMAHIVNLDALATGTADATIMWQFAGGALTWSRIAEDLQARSAQLYAEPIAAMAEQLLVARALIDRYRITGEVRFEGTEYAAARDAVEWCDAIATVIDQPTATAAAEWSEQQMQRIQSGGSP